MQSRPRRMPMLSAASLGIALTCAIASLAQAEISVRGTPDAVRIEARHSSVEEVIAALGANFGVRYRSAVALSATAVDGTYSGDLAYVIKRVLVGYSFVIVSSGKATEIRIVGLDRAGSQAQTAVGPEARPSVPAPAPAGRPVSLEKSGGTQARGLTTRPNGAPDPEL